MAKAKEKARGDKKMIIEAFTEMAKERNIDRDLLQGILEETLSQLIKKKYGANANSDIIVNMDKGDIEIYLTKKVVETVEDRETEISLKEAREKSDEEYEIGDEFIEEITLDNIGENFGRRLITLASQGLNQRIRDIEKENIYNEYIDRVGEILVGEIYQIRRNDILVLHNKVELRLPREEQIPNETFKGKKNQTIKALLKEVRRTGSGGVPELILSRASDEFLAKLFEVEIPEIYDGIIKIKAIARDPGERSKVAVMSTDDRVDPVGACVGMKGIRIHSIVRELNNENIDLIEYSDNPKTFIAKALLPAKIKEITISEETRTATVVVSEDQVPLAIGKNGQNVRLASKLTGYSITLIKEGGEDIELSEFKEELGTALYQELKSLGIETAREFLEYDIGELLNVKGMTKDFLIEMRGIILAEFDEAESEEILERIRNYEKEENKENSTEKDTVSDDKNDEIIVDFE
ncbi:MAG: transcription termination factor NusA [Candidatus Kapabacteria bacterium]|nr:transcription termination factor NusA [Candidatus Kapabacteria bacterium]